MATTILGIDLGSYAVKVARLEAGFRSLQLVGIYEQRVPGADALTAEEAALELPPEAPVLLGAPGEDKAEAGADEAEEADAVGDSSPMVLSKLKPRPARTDELLARQLHALEQILSDIKLRGEQVAIALGPEVTLRLIDLPLSDPKKVAQALPFELAGQLMTEPDEQVVDQTLAQLEPRAGGAEGEPGSCWVAACVPRAVLRDRLAALTRVGLDPRLCGATALSPAALLAGRPTPRPRPGVKSAEVLPVAPPAGETPEWPIWIVDLGHRSTHVCAVAGHPSRAGQVVVPFARTIARGGMHLTDALAKHFVLDEVQAEQMKHDHGVEEESDPAIAGTLRQALRPLVRDLRQTLSAYIARYGQGPSKILATGGGAQLRGLLGLLETELGVPLEPLQPPAWASWLNQAHKDTKPAFTAPGASDENIARLRMAGPLLVKRFATGSPAVGLALALAGTVPQVNFRKGVLAYRTDYAFIREKARYLVAFGVALVACAGVWALSSLHVLEKESERLRLQLTTESTALFGEARTDGRLVSQELANVLAADKGGGQSIPTVTALDLLEDISQAAPKENAAGPARLDVVELHIRPKKTDLKATCGSAQYVDDFAAALGKIRCFQNVQKGKVLTVKNTGADGKPVDVKQFSLEITSSCP